MGEAAVDDVGFFDAGIEGDDAGFDFGEHAFADFFLGDEGLNVGFGDGAHEGVGVVFFGADAVGVGDEDEFVGFGGGGDVAGGGVGVDVEFFAGGITGDGGDDGDEVGLAEGLEEGTIDPCDLTDLSDVDFFAVVAGEEHFFGEEGGGGEGGEGHGLSAEGVEGVDDEAVDFAAEGVFSDGEGAFIGEAAALHELRLQTGGFHGVGDGLAPAVDHDGAHADGLHEDDIGEDFAELVIVVHEGAAEFDDDDFFVEALDIAEGFDERFGFLKHRFFDEDVHEKSRPFW